MLDENLPTFYFKQSSDAPALTSLLYLTANGDDPTPQYVFRRADPATQPAARNRYAAALTDTAGQDVVYAEVLVDPDWTQPTLSAAELRQNGGVNPPPVAQVPDSFTLQLYAPDQQVGVKLIPGSFTSREGYEFEMPQQSFRLPSASKLDRSQDDPHLREAVPKVTFRWKRDGRLSKDMTCYMVGKSVGGRRSKDPDITVALYKFSNKEDSVTIYEPNLHRVEVEDRKGLEVVILLSSQVIKDLYLAPGKDPFNLSPGAAGSSAGGASAAVNGRRKNSRPSPTHAATSDSLLDPVKPAGPALASQALPTTKPPRTVAFADTPASTAAPAAANARPPPADPRTQWEIDAETRRLQQMVEKEEREREKRERAEQKRIKKMIEEEEKERRRREAEVEKETERLRKKYGIEGQDIPSARPALPPRPGAASGSGSGHGNHGHGQSSSSSRPSSSRPTATKPDPQTAAAIAKYHQHFAATPSQPYGSSRPPQHHQLPGGSSSGWANWNWFSSSHHRGQSSAAAPAGPPLMTSAISPAHVPPPRPSSAGPIGGTTPNSWWRAPNNNPTSHPPPQPPRPQQQQQQGSRPSGGGLSPYAGHLPAAAVSAFFGRRSVPNEDERRSRVQKKRSVHF